MDNRFYKFPFIREFNIKWNMDVIDLTQPVTSSQTIKSLFANFFKYVENNYGVKPEESTHIWGRYIDKLPK